MRAIFSWVVALGYVFVASGQSVVPDSLLQQVITLAAQDSRLQNRTVACLVDFSKPSYEKRLWIINLTNGECLLHTWVAHGRGTGRTAEAKVFSNESGTYCSSLGLFLPKGKFKGKHGLSLRLTGLEPGLNDNAETRGIIFHAAAYVNLYNATVRKRQGNSQGCFVVPESDIKPLVQLLESRQAFVWAMPGVKSLL
jgi:L,D-transpeptidase catalytic domain